jgi:hypothetical protein
MHYLIIKIFIVFFQTVQQLRNEYDFRSLVINKSLYNLTFFHKKNFE